MKLKAYEEREKLKRDNIVKRQQEHDELSLEEKIKKQETFKGKEYHRLIALRGA